MKRFLLLFSLLASHQSLAEAYLLDTISTDVAADAAEPSFQSLVQWQQSTERLANHHDYYAEQSAKGFVAQLCAGNEAWCVGIAQEKQDTDIALVDETEAFTYRSEVQSEALYLAHQYRYRYGTGSAKLGVNEAGNVSGTIELSGQDAGHLSIFYDQDDMDADMAVRGEINNVSKTFYSSRERMITHVGIRAAYEWSPVTLGISAEQLWDGSQYRRNRLAFNGKILEHWFFNVAQDDISDQGAIYSQGDSVNRLDDWSLSSRQTKYSIGYVVDDDWYVGFKEESYHLSAAADVQCSNKNWGLSGVEQTLACLFVAPFASFDGELDYQYRGLELGKEIVFHQSKLMFVNGFGRVDWHTKVNTKADESSFDSESGSEWLWLPSIAWQYSTGGWSLQYRWRQIIPLETLENLWRSNDSKSSVSSVSSGGGAGSEANKDVSKDWLWPQVGGYHQLTLAYLW